MARPTGLRVGLLGALLLASACNFTIAGVTSTNRGGDAGSAPPPIADGAASADLAPSTPADLAAASTRDMTSLPVNVGDACAGACGAGLTCMTWVPAGYCTKSCDSGSAVCPTGTNCVDIGSGAHYCMLSSGGNCARPDLSCRDCGSDVCAPANLCGGGC